MATRTAKLRVELDGEKEYKQAISELNKGNQVLASEMRKLQAEYKGNEKSIEALNAKNDLLQRQMQQQADKVKTLREALANATKQYGEADKRTQEWQIQLNNAEAALINMGHQMQENNDLIENGKSGEIVGNSAAELADAIVKLKDRPNVRDGYARKAGETIQEFGLEKVEEKMRAIYFGEPKGTVPFGSW